MKYEVKQGVRDRLFSLSQKKSRLVLSADVTSFDKLLLLAEELGPHIAVLKTHMDILEDFTFDKILKLQALSQELDFLLFEDRKFADIGSTVSLQYQKGIYRIAEWADIVNVHPLTGPHTIEVIQQINPEVGILLVAQMSSENNLLDERYTAHCLRMADDFPSVIGFIAQQQLSPKFLTFTPGVHLTARQDGKGQNWRGPDEVKKSGSDFMIVGRSILNSSSPIETAIEFNRILAK